MSIPAKRNISGLISFVCAVCIVYGIAHIIPYGMAGEIGKAKPYIVLAAIAFTVSLPFAVAYYYYRGQGTAGDQELERMRTEVAMLSQVGQHTMQPREGSQQNPDNTQQQGPPTNHT